MILDFRLEDANREIQLGSSSFDCLTPVAIGSTDKPVVDIGTS